MLDLTSLTLEDRLLSLLDYLKTDPLQVAPARMFGWRQNTTNQWLRILLPVLQSTLQPLGNAPNRSLAALVWWLDVALADMTGAGASDAPTASSSLLFATMAPNEPIPRPQAPNA